MQSSVAISIFMSASMRTVWTQRAGFVFLQICICMLHYYCLCAVAVLLESALVEILVGKEAQLSLSPAHSAWLEVWTDDVTLPVSAKRHQQQAAVHDQIHGQLHISIQAFSVVNPGKNCYGCELIIGKPGMLTLGD